MRKFSFVIGTWWHRLKGFAASVVANMKKLSFPNATWWRKFRNPAAVILVFFVCFVALIQKMDTLAFVALLLFVAVIYPEAAMEVANMIGALGRRATKVSAFQVTVELAAPSTTLNLSTLPDYSEIIGGLVSTTTTPNL